MHVLHQGRARYTLIHPPNSPSNPDNAHPRVEHVTLGTNIAAGEVRQLLVGASWKMSEIPEEDLIKVQKGEVSEENVGCLITEVVVPGFEWEDHEFITKAGLEKLFGGEEANAEGKKWVEALTPHVKK